MVGKRCWTYSRSGWEPNRRWQLFFGGDEWGRKTVVIPIPWGGYLVFAYKTCKCTLCDQIREQTAADEIEHKEHDESPNGCNCPPDVYCYYNSPIELAGVPKDV